MSNDLMTTTVASTVTVDPELVMKALKLDQRDPNTHALLLVCERYGLDPLLKHMVLIQSNPYVNVNGYLSIAHKSGKFDGMTVDDTGETQTHYTAKVSVYRKDMTRPFTYLGRFPKSKSMAKEYGPEMAVKVAEVQALRRVFNVTGVAAADERWDNDDEAPALSGPQAAAQDEGRPPPALPAGSTQPRGPASPPVASPAQPQLPHEFTDDQAVLAPTQWRREFLRSVGVNKVSDELVVEIIQTATAGRSTGPVPVGSPSAMVGQVRKDEMEAADEGLATALVPTGA